MYFVKSGHCRNTFVKYEVCQVTTDNHFTSVLSDCFPSHVKFFSEYSARNRTWMTQHSVSCRDDIKSEVNHIAATTVLEIIALAHLPMWVWKALGKYDSLITRQFGKYDFIFGKFFIKLLITLHFIFHFGKNISRSVLFCYLFLASKIPTSLDKINTVSAETSNIIVTHVWTEVILLVSS